MIKGHNVDFCKENCLVVLHLSCMSVLSHISGFDYFGSAVGFSVFFNVLSCHIPSSYIILPPSGLHVAEMDKKDVSRTEICLDPSIFFWMEGIHVNMSCLSILQYLFHLSSVACFIIKAPFFYTRHARGRRLC